MLSWHDEATLAPSPAAERRFLGLGGWWAFKLPVLALSIEAAIGLKSEDSFLPALPAACPPARPPACGGADHRQGRRGAVLLHRRALRALPRRGRRRGGAPGAFGADAERLVCMSFAWPAMFPTFRGSAAASAVGQARTGLRLFAFSPPHSTHTLHSLHPHTPLTPPPPAYPPTHPPTHRPCRASAWCLTSVRTPSSPTSSW